MKHCILIAMLLALAACASFDARQHADKLRTAVQDDQACRSKGLKFPEDPYVTCRMQLQDDRIHQDWLNLQVMRQSQQQPQNVPAPYTPREFYRPLDPAHFVCLLTTEEDKREYVICDETDEPQKP
jgi:hypothetical protein